MEKEIGEEGARRRGGEVERNEMKEYGKGRGGGGEVVFG